jgi:uncharacterized protein
MIKHIVLLCLIFCNCIAASAQKLFFNRANYSDSALFEKHIPTLAAQLAEQYPTDYDNLFRIQIAARQYPGALHSLKKVVAEEGQDTIKGSFIGFGYHTYLAALLSKDTTLPFSDRYQKEFYSLYNSLSEGDQVIAGGYFDIDIDMAWNKLAGICHSLEKSDSINTKDAFSLCRAYASVLTYSTIQPLAQQFLRVIESGKYIVQDSVLIKMPDGGLIATAIVRDRKATAPQPVVLLYNIYAGGEVATCKEAVVKGYTGVVCNTRGKRLSPDSIMPFEYDGQDAYHIIEWISKQPWCNGQVVMYGGSYLGFAQWSAVKKPHPALKAIVPQVSVGAGIDYPMFNGVFVNYMLQWIHYVTNNKFTDIDDFRNSDKWTNLYKKWYARGASFRSLDSLDGKPNTIFQRWLQHPAYDAYWQKMTPQKQEYNKITIPVLTTTGYWDDDQVGAMYYYKQHHQWNKNPNHYLLIGPYDHDGAQGYPAKVLDGYLLDSVANIIIQDVMFGWFDFILKGKPRPAILKDKVNFQVMGANEWRHVPALKNMANDTLRFYLSAVKNKDRHVLTSGKPLQPSFISQVVDLRDRTEVDTLDRKQHPVRYKTLDTAFGSKKHELVFETAPFKETVTISGASIASFFTRINKKDIDIAYRVYEQTYDGKYLALFENWQRASYAKDRTKRILLTPGKIAQVDIANTFTTCRQLQKGSRLVMVIGMVKLYNAQLNYGTGKDVSDETILDAKVPFKIDWFTNSCIQFPVLK